MKNSALLLLSSLLWLGCDPEPETPEPETPAPTVAEAPQPPQEEPPAASGAAVDTFFPTAAGTTWTYTSEKVTGSNTETTEQTYTLKETQTTDSGETALTFAGETPFGIVAVKDNTVFEEISFRGGGSDLTQRFYRPAQPEETFSTLYGGDVSMTVTVKKLDEPVTVPAGTFKDCYTFHRPLSEVGELATFCEGVGVVRFTHSDTVYGGPTGAAPYTQTITLKAFQPG